MRWAFKALERSYLRSPGIKLGEKKFIVFSDLHMGDGAEGSDDFLPNREILFHALNHYFMRGWHPILLGDVEELWECNLEDVLRTYSDIYRLLEKFKEEGRFLRILGNHDIFLGEPSFRKGRGLDSESLFLPVEGLRIEAEGGSLFLTHGHQIDFLSSRLWKLSRFIVRFFWKPVQLLLRISSTSPSRNYRKRNRFERTYFEWARRKGVVFIAGHTHRPMFESLAKVDRLRMELERARSKKRPAQELAELQKAIERKLREEGESPSLQAVPCYFNAGCCVFPDRVITGIELEPEKIRLVAFREKDGLIRRIVYQEESLTRIFEKLTRRSV